MIAFWKWKELYCGISLDVFSKIKNQLEDINIEFKYKLNKHDDTPPFRGFARNSIGRVGEITSSSTMYYIYVKKNDYIKLKQLLNL